jgi:biopolymer transport protein ExbD
MVAVALWSLAFLTGNPSDDAPLQVRFVHEGACGVKPCPKERHWKFQAGDRALGDTYDFAEAIQAEADAQRAGAPRPDLSERIVVFGGDRSAPWATVMWAMRQCAQAGIYKMAWLKPGGGKGAFAHKFWLKDPVKDDRCRLADPQISLRWDDALGGLIRGVPHRRSMATMDELMAGLREQVSDMQKAGKTEWVVEIDPGADVPWKHVIEVMDRCRSDGFENLEILPVLRRKAAPQK